MYTSGFYLEILACGRSAVHIACFWQFSCKIPLRIAKGFGGESEHFGGEASPPLDRTPAI